MNEDLNAQLERLILLVDELSIRTNEIGISFNGKKGSEIKLHGFVYLDLMNRINSNLEALLVLLKQLKDSPELKIPISLILRGCLSDVLTGYYLNSFLSDEETFENEINVLGLDYINYVEDMIHNEPLFVNPSLSHNERESIIKERMRLFAKENNELIKSYDEKDNKWEKYGVKELRKTSHEKAFSNEIERSKKPTDKFKYERIKSIVELRQASYVYVLMRYYAQYQHYAFYNRLILALATSDNFKFYVQAFYHINHAILDFSRIIKADKFFIMSLEKLLDHFKGLSGLTEVKV